MSGDGRFAPEGRGGIKKKLSYDSVLHDSFPFIPASRTTVRGEPADENRTEQVVGFGSQASQKLPFEHRPNLSLSRHQIWGPNTIPHEVWDEQHPTRRPN